MSRTTTFRKYGKSDRRTRAEQLFEALPTSPPRRKKAQSETDPNEVIQITKQLVSVALDEKVAVVQEKEKVHLIAPTPPPSSPSSEHRLSPPKQKSSPPNQKFSAPKKRISPTLVPAPEPESEPLEKEEEEAYKEESTAYSDDYTQDLRILTWSDICPPENSIEKIAEASYAEVYRITNSLGTSIIKVVRLESPIKPQTKAQERSGLVDEEPHTDDDMLGELQISEWLADIPGFVIYKERYVVKGKAPKALLETHQAFHRREKRKDPDRLQWYPSPSRYLDETEFLVVELGDAGTALEDFPITTVPQIWDIFLHTAIALARAEDLIEFEHRDLHEGNLCIRQARPASTSPSTTPYQFGHSGLEITILDYGLSRASDPDHPNQIMFYDLEKDLSIFTSTHAPQCEVYRCMRSYLLRGDRCNLPPKYHTTPYSLPPTAAKKKRKRINWEGYHPYTNVLWLDYIYNYLIENFQGGEKVLKEWEEQTRELRVHLDPGQPREVLSFGMAGEVVRFAVEAGWVGEEQLMDGGGSCLSAAGGGESEGETDEEEEEEEEEEGESETEESGKGSAAEEIEGGETHRERSGRSARRR
ncbi:putative serine/threonine-protein kinase [Triangularia setosa]|uniref:non-specific serine/threonine protein kinase n=1 Tax=Triangularia setosa TaxID=2587417 RepID=A0AAN7AB83_9PEZI|nr:putative serine/threonine-protein kinase [Podospora setosa]